MKFQTYSENAAVALTWKFSVLLRKGCEKHAHMLRILLYIKFYEYCFILCHVC
jgi:hypothetical protein